MTGGHGGGRGSRGAWASGGRGRAAGSPEGQPAKVSANGADATRSVGAQDGPDRDPVAAAPPPQAQQQNKKKQQEQPQQPAATKVKKKRLSRELMSLQRQPLPELEHDARGQRHRGRDGPRWQAAEGQPAAKRARAAPQASMQRSKAAGKKAVQDEGEVPEEQPNKKSSSTAEAQRGAQAGAGLPAPVASQQSTPQPAAGQPCGASGADQRDAAGSSQLGAAAHEEHAGQAEARDRGRPGTEAERQQQRGDSQRQGGTASGGASQPGGDSPSAAAPAAPDAPSVERQGIKAEGREEPEGAVAPDERQPAHERAQQQAQQQSQQQQAAQPAGALAGGPFAAHLGAVAGVLRHRPGCVLAAAMLLHGALAAGEPAGEPGSGHALAWRVTASFLRALLPPAGVQRLSGSARGYAAVAVAAATAQREKAKQLAQQRLAAPQAPPQQQQQQQAPAGGRSPVHVDSRAQLTTHARPAGEHGGQGGQGGQGLVGAAKRKASKPRSTHETLGLPAAAAAAASSGGRRGGSEPPPSGRARRRRVRQPDRLAVQLGSGKSYDPLPPRAGGSGVAKPGRAAVPLCDIPLPREPLPRWGVQRARGAGAAPTAPLSIEGLPALSALAAGLGGGPAAAAEVARLRRELREAREQRVRSESRLQQLQQQLAGLAGSGSGGSGRTRSQRGDGASLLERERLADQQAMLAAEAGRLRAERQQLEHERREFRSIVEGLAQSLLQPGSGLQLPGAAAAAIQAAAAFGGSGSGGTQVHPPPPVPQPVLQQSYSNPAQKVQPALGTLPAAGQLPGPHAAVRRPASQAPGTSALPLGRPVGSARPLLSRLAQAPPQGQPAQTQSAQAAGQLAAWAAASKSAAGTGAGPGRVGGSKVEQIAGQLQDALRDLMAQAAQHVQQAQQPRQAAPPPAQPVLLPAGASAQHAQQAGLWPAQVPDLSFLRGLVSNGSVTPQALIQVLTNLLGSGGSRAGGGPQAQQLASMLALVEQQLQQQAGTTPTQHAATQQKQQKQRQQPPASAAGAQRYLSLAAQQLSSDAHSALSPGAAAVASGHAQPITTGAAGMPALQPASMRAPQSSAAVPRLAVQQQQQQQHWPAAPLQPPPAAATLPAVTLPPVLKAQLGLLPAEMQPQLEQGIAKLCRDLANGSLHMDKLLGSLHMDAGQRERLAQLLRQLLAPQAAAEAPPPLPLPQQPLIVRARPVSVQPAPEATLQLPPPPHAEQLAHLVDALDRSMQHSRMQLQAVAQQASAGSLPPTVGMVPAAQGQQQVAPAGAPQRAASSAAAAAGLPAALAAYAPSAPTAAAAAAPSPAQSGDPPALPVGGVAGGAATAAPPAAAGAQASGAMPAPAAVQRSGSGAVTPEVSPSPMGGRSTPDGEAAAAAVAPRFKTASPVLHQVTDDDVAPVHKQLPPIRTSSVPEALRRTAAWQQAVAAAQAPAAGKARGLPAVAPAAQPGGKRKSPEPAADAVAAAAEPSLTVQPPAKQARAEEGAPAAGGSASAGGAAAEGAAVTSLLPAAHGSQG